MSLFASSMIAFSNGTTQCPIDSTPPDSTACNPLTWRRHFLADGAWFCVSMVGALTVGLAGDQLFRKPSLGWSYQSPALRSLTSHTLINLVSVEEVEALLVRADVIVLDARPPAFFEMGHLAGARNLSREQFDKDFASLETILRAPGQTLLIYCSDVSCEDGALIARTLQQRGFTSLLLFPGGIAEWEGAGKPLEAAH